MHLNCFEILLRTKINTIVTAENQGDEKLHKFTVLKGKNLILGDQAFSVTYRFKR